MVKKIEKSDQEWCAQLTDEQFRIARRAGTERPFTHDSFSDEIATFTCICCDAPLFGRHDKFDSGTGWPSFTKPLSEQAVEERKDRSLLGIPRTEVRCATCSAHLGHVFKDGPQPTGLRYCINGSVLKGK